MSYQLGRNLQQRCMQSQRGMVVIVALFLVAIVAAMAYAMLASLSRDTHRTQLILRDLELSYYAEGGIAWAKDHLLNNLLKKTPDQRVDTLPISSPVDTVNGYRIVSRIYDMQSRYNINRLGDNTGEGDEKKAEFGRLFSALKINLEQKKLDELFDAIKDWVQDTKGRPDLNRYYLEQAVPYQAAHQPMAHISELRLVKGMTAELYALVSPYLVALPSSKSTVIDIFTASPPVLLTLSPKLNMSNVLALQEALAVLNTSDPTKILSLPIVANLELKQPDFTVVSEYFLVETRVSVESQQLVVYTLMKREQDDQKAVTVKIMWQSKGIA